MARKNVVEIVTINPRTAEDRAERAKAVRTMADNGMTDRQIGEKLGLAPSRVWTIRTGYVRGGGEHGTFPNGDFRKTAPKRARVAKGGRKGPKQATRTVKVRKAAKKA